MVGVRGVSGGSYGGVLGDGVGVGGGGVPGVVEVQEVYVVVV